MTETAYFIEARALSLEYEAIHFPAKAPVALAWLGRAIGWAQRHGTWCLAETLRGTVQRIEDSMAELERPCPHCGREMEEGIIGADCAGGSHREINGWYCERCDYSETEDGHVPA